MGASLDAALGGFAVGAVGRGAGEHAVLGGEPAADGLAVLGDARGDGGGAEDHGLAGADEDASRGQDGEAGVEFHAAELIGGAAVVARCGHGRSSVGAERVGEVGGVVAAGSAPGSTGGAGLDASGEATG